MYHLHVAAFLKSFMFMVDFSNMIGAGHQGRAIGDDLSPSSPSTAVTYSEK